jgi:hypothetical protein
MDNFLPEHNPSPPRTVCLIGATTHSLRSPAVRGPWGGGSHHPVVFGQSLFSCGATRGALGCFSPPLRVVGMCDVCVGGGRGGVEDLGRRGQTATWRGARGGARGGGGAPGRPRPRAPCVVRCSSKNRRTAEPQNPSPSPSPSSALSSQLQLQLLADW